MLKPHLPPMVEESCTGHFVVQFHGLCYQYCYRLNEYSCYNHAWSEQKEYMTVHVAILLIYS